MTRTQLNGIPVIISPNAVSITHVWCVVAHPIKKRRRQWRAIQQEIHNPTAYRTPHGLVMHPALFDELKRDHT